MILVTGATGSIGRPLVRMLAEAELPFRALVRSERQGRALGCDFVVGDLDHPASVSAALAGANQLLLNSGGAMPVTGQQPMVRQQTAAINAAQEAGVSRVVKVSAWRPSAEAKLSVRAHWEIEEHLQGTTMGWSLLRPTGFMQNFFTGEGGFAYRDAVSGPYGAGRVAYIDTHDVAASAFALLTTPGVGNAAYDLTGPEALAHAEIAAKLGAPYREQTPEEAGTLLREQGLPGWFVDDLLWLYADMAAGGLSEVTATVEVLTGRPPRTFDAFLAERS